MKDLFDKEKSATNKELNKIVNTYLKKEIVTHYLSYNENNKEAFSTEGIITLNKKLAEKKNKDGELAPHTPISSMKVFYRDPTKVKLKKGQEELDETLQRLDRKKAYNNSLYVKTGDNYLFAVMEKDGKRIFDLITFFDATNLLKVEFNKCCDKRLFNKDLVFKNYFEEKCDAKLLFTLRQGDPVYMPKEAEDIITDHDSSLFNDFWNKKEQRSDNIFYVTKFSGNEIYFLKHSIADPILKGKELGSQNALQNIAGKSIKQHCMKIMIDRLGNISL